MYVGRVVGDIVTDLLDDWLWHEEVVLRFVALSFMFGTFGHDRLRAAKHFLVFLRVFLCWLEHGNYAVSPFNLIVSRRG